MRKAETLRRATEADAEEIAGLVNRAYRPEGGGGGWSHESALVAGMRTGPDRIRKSIAQADSVILVAQTAGEIIACVHVEKKEAGAGIGMLAVAPALQDKGIGRWLLDEAEQFAARTLACTTLTMVVISQREELIAFYLRRGYRRTGAVSGYPSAQGFGTPVSPLLTIEVLEKFVGPEPGEAIRDPRAG